MKGELKMENSNKLSPNMEMKTKSIADENIEKIKALFPNCVTEAKDEKTGEIKHVIDFVVHPSHWTLNRTIAQH